MKKIFCCPALELFHCLPLWKTVLFVSSRAFSLSTPTFLLSTPVEATWKKATKCNKEVFLWCKLLLCSVINWPVLQFDAFKIVPWKMKLQITFNQTCASRRYFFSISREVCEFFRSIKISCSNDAMETLSTTGRGVDNWFFFTSHSIRWWWYGQ